LPKRQAASRRIFRYMPSSFSGMSRQRNSWTGRPSGASKGEWRGGPQKDGGGFGDALDAAVGKRAAAAEAGGTEFFACEERVEGLRVGKPAEVRRRGPLS